MTSTRITALFTEVEPPQDLFKAVLARIALARRRAARGRLAALGMVIIVSTLALIPTVQYAGTEFYASGFYEYASLFFDGVAHGYWQDVLYSLANSLPSLALLLLLSIGISFGWSLRRALRDLPVAFAHPAFRA